MIKATTPKGTLVRIRSDSGYAYMFNRDEVFRLLDISTPVSELDPLSHGTAHVQQFRADGGPGRHRRLPIEDLDVHVDLDDYKYKMPNESFKEMVTRRVETTINTMVAKGEEYALDGDRFHNFKEASKSTRESENPLSAPQALYGMMLKHLTSVKDLCDGSLLNSEHYVDEKIGDSIAYLLLLEGLLKERRDATE